MASLFAALLLGCAVVAQPDERPNYLRYVAFEARGGEHVLLRWDVSRMPLKVYAPAPPAEWFEDAEAVRANVRAAILDWADAAEPGLPAFEFVDRASDADIPVLWAYQTPDNMTAHCTWDVDVRTNRYGVSHVYLPSRLNDGTVLDPDLMRKLVRHEFGHALGLAGHSPNPEDAMYFMAHGAEPGSFAAHFLRPNRSAGLTDRDRATLRELYRRPVGSRMTGARDVY